MRPAGLHDDVKEIGFGPGRPKSLTFFTDIFRSLTIDTPGMQSFVKSV